MPKTPPVTAALAVAAALATIGTAQARPPATVIVEATYSPHSGHFCVDPVPAMPDYPDSLHAPIRGRACLTQRQWRNRGFHFDVPQRAPR